MTTIDLMLKNAKVLPQEECIKYYIKAVMGDKKAFEVLINSVTPFILRKLPVFRASAQLDDAYQMILLKLWKLVKDGKYDWNKSTWVTYVGQVMSWELPRFIRSECYMIRVMNANSLDSAVHVDYLSSKVEVGLEEEQSELEKVQELTDEVVSIAFDVLKGQQKDVFEELMLRNKKQSEIAKEWGCSKQYISQVWNKAKDKIRNAC